MPAVTICILQPYYAECMSGQAAERKVQKLAKKEYRKNKKEYRKRQKAEKREAKQNSGKGIDI